MAEKFDDSRAVRDHREKDWSWFNNAFYDARPMPGTGELKTFAAVLGSSAVNVYMYLARRSDVDTQTCYPSYNTIASLTGMSLPTAIQSIQKLIAHGLIKSEDRYDDGGDRTSNFYTLLPVSQWSLEGSKNILLPSKTATKGAPKKAKAKPRGSKNILEPPEAETERGSKESLPPQGEGSKNSLEPPLKNFEDRSSNNFMTGSKNSLPYQDSVDQDSVDQQQQVVVVDDQILNDLLTAHIGYAAAQRLVASDPEECRRQLLYLPHHKKVRNSGPFLAKAIREKYGAPEAYLAAQEQTQTAARSQEARRQEERDRAAQAEKERLRREAVDRSNEMIDQMFATLDTRTQQRIDDEATERLGVLGRAGRNESALKAMRRTLLRERLGNLVQEDEQVNNARAQSQ